MDLLCINLSTDHFQNEVIKNVVLYSGRSLSPQSHLACVRGAHNFLLLFEAIISLFYFVLSYVALCPYVVSSALSGSSFPSSPDSNCFHFLQVSILGLCPNYCHSNPIPCRKLAIFQNFVVVSVLKCLEFRPL